jgi:hypothetical protein
MLLFLCWVGSSLAGKAAQKAKKEIYKEGQHRSRVEEMYGVILLRKVFARHFSSIALFQQAAQSAGATFTEREGNDRTNYQSANAAEQNAPEKDSITQECHR